MPDRVVSWERPEPPPGAAEVRRGPALVGAAVVLVLVLAGNALVGWVSRADERRAEGRAAAVERLFTQLEEGDREAYLAGGLHRVERAGIAWDFLRRLSEDDPGAAGPGDTRVEASCRPVGPHVVRCSLVQRGGPFATAGIDTAARGYFVVDESGTVRRSWVELVADDQRVATFVRELRVWLSEHHPEVHRRVYDTDLPVLHRRAFQDTLTNRRLLTTALRADRAPR